MGVMTAFGWVMKGGRGPFDTLQGVIEMVEEVVEKADISVEFHVGDGPVPEGYARVDPGEYGYMQELMGKGSDVEGHTEAHYFDRKQDLLDRLKEAKEQVEAIWYLVLESYEVID